MAKVDEYEARFAKIVEGIDFARVEEAIIGGTPMMDFDILDARACIFAIIERWLLQDLDNFKLDQLEGKIAVTKNGEEIFKAYLDIRGTLTGHAREFKAYAGQRFVLDWKTARGNLDKRWHDRHVLSQQWRQYTWAETEKPALFIYRGVRRPSSPGEAPALREIIISPAEYTKDNQSLTQIQIDGLMVMRDALMNSGLGIWPRNMPEGCNAYGQPCPYLEDCDIGDIPVWQPPAGKVMSYSRWKTFQTCPERSRRDLMPGAGDDGSDMTRFGLAVHRGLAEVYSQVFNVPVLTRDEQESTLGEIE